MEEQKVEILYDGAKLNIDVVVPQGQKKGFFLVRREGNPYGPVMVNEIILGDLRLVATNDYYHTDSLEHKLAAFIKKLVEENSPLIKTDTSSTPFIPYRDLTDAFNAAHDFGEAGVSAAAVRDICRTSLFLATYRLATGWGCQLDLDALNRMSEKYGLGGIDLSLAPGKDAINGDLK